MALGLSMALLAVVRFLGRAEVQKGEFDTCKLVDPGLASYAL
jgi:hypothetical protein